MLSKSLLWNGDILANIVNSDFGKERVYLIFSSEARVILQTFSVYFFSLLFTLLNWCLSLWNWLLNMKGVGALSIAFPLRAQKLEKQRFFHCWSSQQWVDKGSHTVTGRSGGSQGIHVHASWPPDYCGLLSSQTSCGLLSQ